MTHKSHGQEESAARDSPVRSGIPGSVESVPLEGRRKVLAYLTGLVGAAIAAALGIPLAAFYVAPSLARRRPVRVNLGPVSSLRPGEPTKFTYSYFRVDGWLEKVVRGTAYAVMTDNGIFVLSNICTHLGCGVRWDRDAKAFLCPCHDGRFDIRGKVIAGPPPKPLPRFTHDISGGTLRIQIEEA